MYLPFCSSPSMNYNTHKQNQHTQHNIHQTYTTHKQHSEVMVRSKQHIRQRPTSDWHASARALYRSLYACASGMYTDLRASVAHGAGQPTALVSLETAFHWSTLLDLYVGNLKSFNSGSHGWGYQHRFKTIINICFVTNVIISKLIYRLRKYIFQDYITKKHIFVLFTSGGVYSARADTRYAEVERNTSL